MEWAMGSMKLGQGIVKEDDNLGSSAQTLLLTFIHLRMRSTTQAQFECKVVHFHFRRMCLYVPANDGNVENSIDI